MARKVFVDTSAWIAFFDRTDDFHDRAIDFLKTKPHLVTSDVVLHECIAHLENRISKEVAKSFAEAVLINNICDIVFITYEQEMRSLKRYRKTRKKISFVDVTNQVIAEELGLKEIFAFDRDFKNLGLKLVP